MHGGVWLARPPQEIRLSEVIQLLDGPVSLRECVADPDGCPQSGVCAARDVWTELDRTIGGLLASITLQDLVEQQTAKERSGETMYYI